MSDVIVTDSGFGTDDWTGGYCELGALPANDAGFAVDLGPDADPAALVGLFERISLIRVDFPGFADGRGFSIARRLRLLGYRGRLRARGHVIADQYAMARRSGFDEVQIDSALAARQPVEQWQARAAWQNSDYQARLRG
ncbi:DUF934 domain-containing protein [Oceaniglobus trochenteri]|uniref:DUF934 domain-containing protein n=1 Tax=Oceaniglobus trochenteri TaxID=2763260 RepID=UPI001D00184C|nr:DUF934 domain-containing protein [Oceaniglobus trochenteri]